MMDIANTNNGRRYLIGVALLLLFIAVSQFLPWFQFNDDGSLSVDIAAWFTAVFLTLSMSQPIVLLVDSFTSKPGPLNSLQYLNTIHVVFVVLALGFYSNIVGGLVLFLFFALILHPIFFLTLVVIVIYNTRMYPRSRRTELLIAYCVVAINAIYYIDLFRQPFFI